MRSPGFLSILALGVVALGGCRGTGVSSANLDQLLGPDERLQYSARLESGARYLVAQFLDEDWFGGEEGSADRPPEPIPDPSATALKNLLGLRRGQAGFSETWIQAEQVRQYARYAVQCNSALARERSLIELADHARRLGLESRAVQPEVAANAIEIRSALSGLVDVLNDIAVARGMNDTRRADLQAACEVISRLTLDVDGGWRLLKILGRFTTLRIVPRRELGPLLDLSEQVQRGLVAQALAHGRTDPVDRVRAQAVISSEAAYGAPFLRECLLIIAHRRQVGRSYGLPAPGPEDPEVCLAIVNLVRVHGLPLDESLSGPEEVAQRRDLLTGLIVLGANTLVYPDRVRTGAMLALDATVEGVSFGLQSHEWAAWWQEFDREQQALIESAGGFGASSPESATEGGGSGSGAEQP